jgi:hypothetical protein
MTLKTYSLVPLLAFAAMIVPSANSVPLSPGGSAALPTDVENGTLVGFMAIPFADRQFSGGFNEAVFLEGGGTYDFAYQVQVQSASTDVMGLTLTDFTEVQADVVDTNALAPFSVGNVSLTTASRTSAGDAISAAFATPIAAGGTSDVLLVRTNATSFDQLGFLSVNESSGTTIGGTGGIFEPIAPAATVPEPASLPVLGVALLGLGAMWRRRATS